MRVLQVVAGDRWTGAAATALQLAEALREVGVVCDLAFRPGRGLQERLRSLPWCHPVLGKESGPLSLLRNVRALRALAAPCDVVHCHLPHDHMLCRLALPRPAPGARAPVLLRGVHAPEHLKRHPGHRWLFRRTDALALANADLEPACRRFAALATAPAAVLPVALEARFAPGGDRAGARARLGIPTDAFVAGTIGKLDAGRGHDVFLRGVAAALGAWALLIGKGPAVPGLRALAGRVGLEPRLALPGYVEEGLEDLYAAMDVFVFPAAGSDHAHRAIAEAAGCGVPALAADLPGVRDLVEREVTGDLFQPGDVRGLSELLVAWAGDAARRSAAGAVAAARARERFTPTALAGAALALYRAALAATAR